MSPEQCMGEEIDRRADIYSVGVILYEMLVGAVPFNSPTPTAVAVQHATQQPTPPRAINISIPSGVETVVLHALQKRREDRPQTAGALARELTDEINDATQARYAPMPSAQQAFPPPPPSVNSGTMPTVVMSNSAWQSGAMPPVGSTSPHYQNATSSNSKRSLLLAGGGLVVGLVIAATAIAIWVNAKADKDSAKSNLAVVANATSEEPIRDGSAKRNQKSDVVLNASKNAATTSREQLASTPPMAMTNSTALGTAQKGNWLVVVGSYPKAERFKANERLSYLRGLGYDAYIVDTDGYPNLRGGLWAVVMGPYSKSYAKDMVSKLRPTIRDVYIK
jgi:serine/threonine protein kinase